MSTTAKLELEDFDPLDNGQAEFNKMARVLDGMLHCKIRAEDEDFPGDNTIPNPGDVYRVATGSGAWNGENGNFAIGKETIDPAVPSTYNTVDAWNFVTPIEGFIVWMKTLGGHRLTFNSGGWMTPIAIPDITGENEADTVTAFNLLLAKLRAHGVIAT